MEVAIYDPNQVTPIEGINLNALFSIEEKMEILVKAGYTVKIIPTYIADSFERRDVEYNVVIAFPSKRVPSESELKSEAKLLWGKYGLDNVFSSLLKNRLKSFMRTVVLQEKMSTLLTKVLAANIER